MKQKASKVWKGKMEVEKRMEIEMKMVLGNWFRRSFLDFLGWSG